MGSGLEMSKIILRGKHYPQADLEVCGGGGGSCDGLGGAVFRRQPFRGRKKAEHPFYSDR